MTKSQLLKKSYFDWLFKEYSYSELSENVVKIGTPFLDTQFDYITMYVEFFKNNSQINLTDDGWTIQDLESHGVSFSSRNKTNNRLLKTITDSFGVEVVNGELSIMTDIDKFPVAKQRLLQCIIQVNDLVVLQKTNVTNIFFEEVEILLKKNEVLYTTRPSFAGKGGITVQFDFSIPTSNNEKLVKTIRNGNDLNRSKLFTMDTQLVRHSKPDADFIAIFDDISNPIKNINEITSILEENSDSSIIPLTISKAHNEPTLLLNKA